MRSSTGVSIDTKELQGCEGSKMPPQCRCSLNTDAIDAKIEELQRAEAREVRCKSCGAVVSDGGIARLEAL